MTLRDSVVRTTVAPSSGAKSYSFSTCQSVSLRASHGETTWRSISGTSCSPACGIDTMSGASPRATCTQLSILPLPHAPEERIETHAIHEFGRLFDIPDGE